MGKYSQSEIEEYVATALKDGYVKAEENKCKMLAMIMILNFLLLIPLMEKLCSVEESLTC